MHILMEYCAYVREFENLLKLHNPENKWQFLFSNNFEVNKYVVKSCEIDSNDSELQH